jgi:uncharacterized membrane protein
MPETIQVEINPKSFVMAKGATAEATATVWNRGEVIDQAVINIEGIDAQWYTVPVSSVALFPNDRDNFKIILHLPDTPEIRDGSYTFYANVVSQENRERATRIPLTIEIRSRPKVRLSISPDSLSGRQGSFQVTVENPSDGEVVVSLKLDGATQIRHSLKPNSLTVPAHGRADSDLDVKVGWLPFITGPEKAINFTVSAKPVTANLLSEEAVTVKGQFINRPWYKALATIKIPWFEKPPVITAFKIVTQDKKEFKLTWAVKKANKVTINDGEVEPVGETLVRPTEPTVFKLSAQNKHGIVKQDFEAIPVPPPKAKTSDLIHLSLTPAALRASAGQMSAQTVFEIKNLGEAIDKFLITVEGLEEEWYSRGASSVSLFPQKSSDVALTLQPPKKKGVKSGIYTFGVTVQSQSKPLEVATVIGQLEVLPFPEFKLEMRPIRVSCRRKGSYRVVLNNTGVTDLDFTLSATDMDEGCRFNFKSEKLRVSAWNTVEIPLTVKPKRNFLLGEKKRYDLVITATPISGVPQSANAELNHSPLMASWKPIFRIIRAIIVLAVITWAVYSLINLGGGWNVLTNDPKAWLWNLELLLEGWIQAIKGLISK